ncbi:MAG: hypothetical protein HUK21_03015, partial [Fibrobacteraceae bacterium]|nr:hypothetical protein [Fibrobacteraceae bacterium]
SSEAALESSSSSDMEYPLAEYGCPSCFSGGPQESSSSLADLESSSSEVPPESSSSQNVFGKYPYFFRLASDTTVLCKDSTSFIQVPISSSDTPSPYCSNIKSQMEMYQGKSEEEMLELEERLDQCGVYEPLYGVPQLMGQSRHQGYKCTDGNLYPFEKDGLVYTKEEFLAKFPSSSSAEPESSSSEGATACERNDFVYKENIDAELLYDMKTAKQDSLGGELQCDEPRPEISYDGMIAKTIVCGGEESENPRYTQYVQTKKEEIDKYLASCKKKEVSSSSSANEGGSSSSILEIAPEYGVPVDPNIQDR